MLSARERLVELWAELALHTPSQARLDTIAVALRKAIAEADETFSRLLRLNPSAVPIIRRYAAFLRDVRAHAPPPPLFHPWLFRSSHLRCTSTQP